MARLKATPRSKAKNAYELLNDVCRVVLDEPKRVHMDAYITAFQNPGRVACEIGDGPACGTVGCIGGWVAILKRRPHVDLSTTLSISNIAANLLTDEEGVLKDIVRYPGSLFSDSLFDKHGDQQDYKYGTREYARAVVRKIRAFQKRHKAALLAKAV